MKQLNEYDARQLRKIEAVIAEYNSGKKSLYGLIGDIEFLIDALEDVDDNFKSVLLHEWGRLEIVYAMALDMRKALDQTDLEEINDAVYKLIEAIAKAGGGKVEV